MTLIRGFPEIGACVCFIGGGGNVSALELGEMELQRLPSQLSCLGDVFCGFCDFPFCTALTLGESSRTALLRLVPSPVAMPT